MALDYTGTFQFSSGRLPAPEQGVAATNNKMRTKFRSATTLAAVCLMATLFFATAIFIPAIAIPLAAKITIAVVGLVLTALFARVAKKNMPSPNKRHNPAELILSPTKNAKIEDKFELQSDEEDSMNVDSDKKD